MSDDGSFTLDQALLDWGTRDESYQISTYGDDDIVIWHEKGMIYDSYSCFAAYRCLHAGIPSRDEIPLITQYPSPENIVLRKVRPPMVSERLEVLLVELTKLYPDLWTRDDWYVTKRR